MADKIATRKAYGESLVEMGKVFDNLVVLDGDLSKSTMTNSFKENYPERFFNAGISEQNLYGMASGLALSGKIVCASTFAMFATGRAFEIIRNSIGYTSANVKICATHAGITVGEDGGSHQTFEDIALMKTIPNMMIVNPSDSNQTKALFPKILKHEGPVYLRLGRLAIPQIYSENEKFELGKGNVLAEGKDACIIATGLMVHKAIEARDILSSKGIDVSVIDIHTIKPIDQDLILEYAKKNKLVITAEEHSIIGGLGASVSQLLSEKLPTRVISVGQKDVFGRSGKPEELLEAFNMDTSDIVDAVLKALKFDN